MSVIKKIDKYLKEGCKKKLKEEEDMGPKYRCNECGWIYDPAKAGKPFSEQPSSYKCPKCGAPKSDFSKV